MFYDFLNINENENKNDKSKSISNTKRIENDTLSDSLSKIKSDQEKEDKIIKLEDGEYTILGIQDISVEKPKNEAMIINADLGGKEIKRGDIIWITAMVQKKNVNWNSMAVLKVRVQDMFQGLSILNTLK